MKFIIDAQSSDDYGDYATVRLVFGTGPDSAESWIEIDAADAHDINKPRDPERPYGQGAKITVHHADGTEEVVWDGLVMPAWFAKRRAEKG